MNDPEVSRLAAVGKKLVPIEAAESVRFIKALEQTENLEDLPRFAQERLEAIREAKKAEAEALAQ